MITKEATGILDALCRKYGAVLDWSDPASMAYAERLVNQCIEHEIRVSYAWIIISLAAILIAIIIVAVIHHYVCYPDDHIKYSDYDDSILSIGWTNLAIVVLVGAVVIAFQVDDIITCTSFPDKMILEILAGGLFSIT